MSGKAGRCVVTVLKEERPKLSEQNSEKKVEELKELQKPSIYEIHFKSSLSFNNSKEILRFCLADVAPLALEKNKDENFVLKIFENSLIESHYPRFPDTETETEAEIEEQKIEIKTADLKIQTSFNAHNRNVDTQIDIDNDASPPVETKNVEIKDEIIEVKQATSQDTISSEVVCYANQAPSKSEHREEREKENVESVKMSSQTKKQVMKSLFAKSTVVPSSSVILTDNSDVELLHLHHHEHHHYYYFDHGAPSRDNGFHSKQSFASTETYDVEKRFFENRKKLDWERLKQAYYHSGQSASNAAFTKTFYSPETLAERKKIVTSISVESFSRQKSDLLKTHNYSDSELFRFDSGHKTLSVKNSKENDSTVLSSTKSMNDDTTTEDRKSTDDTSCAYKNSTGIVEIPLSNDVTPLNETVNCTVLPPQETTTKETSDKKTNTEPQLVIEASDKGKNMIEGALVKQWVEKVREELQEMKGELQFIEREFLKYKLCLNASRAKPTGNDESDPTISIFSSRTFILRAENFYILEDTDSGTLEESSKILK